MSISARSRRHRLGVLRRVFYSALLALVAGASWWHADGADSVTPAQPHPVTVAGFLGADLFGPQSSASRPAGVVAPGATAPGADRSDSADAAGGPADAADHPASGPGRTVAADDRIPAGTTGRSGAANRAPPRG